MDMCNNHFVVGNLQSVFKAPPPILFGLFYHMLAVSWNAALPCCRKAKQSSNHRLKLPGL